MKKKTKVYVGMDVHKDSVMIAVLPEGAREPTLVRRLSHDPRGIRRLLDRLAREHEVRACYEASGAGYVLEREIRSWGARVRDRGPVADSAAAGRAAQARPQGCRGAGEAVPGGGARDDPSADGAEERVRDLVRCREVLQREALRSRHYVLKFLARRPGVPRGPELDGQALRMVAGDPA